MGHINQLLYLAKFAPREGKVLEIGSKKYPGSIDYREYYPNLTGVDLEPGEGVDVVWDLTQGTGDLETYDLIICTSVLEHVANPWLVALTIMDLMNSGGYVYIAVPWIQRYHAYPDDYWRFSYSGIKKLFPGLEFSHPHYSTFKKKEFIDLEECPEGDNMLRLDMDGRKYLPCLEIHTMGKKDG